MAAPLTDRLSELDAALAEARSRRDEAKAGRIKRANERRETVRSLTADLKDYRAAIRYRNDEVPTPEQQVADERELTAKLCDEIRERGLVLRVERDMGNLVTISDPSTDSDFPEADRAVTQAKEARDGFVDENADALAEEAKSIEVAAIRAALDGDDPDAIREAINGRKHDTTLTTADLA